MPAQSSVVPAFKQGAVLRAAASDLPAKWRADAPAVEPVPTYAEAIAAFRQEFELEHLGIIQGFHSRTSRIAVYGCKLAIEYSNRKTLHLRMRPPGSPWLLTAELVAAWPELNSYVRLRSLDRSWLRVALANIFEAWSKGWLPPGYRYTDPLAAVDGVLGDLLDAAQVAQQWERALTSVLPRTFLRVLGRAADPLANLLDPAAPFRIWNQHRAELENLPQAEPWLREIAPVLSHFPADIPLGPNLEHSLRLMVVQRHSQTVWRFHRRTAFALVPGGDLLVRHGANIAAAIVTGAVKGLGLEPAAAFLTQLGAERFTRMYIDLNEYGSMRDWTERLPLFMARAAAWLKDADALAAREEAMERIIEVLRGLAKAGFAEGFPASNSTWSSLVQRAETWNAPAGLAAELKNLPVSWTVSVPRWKDGDIAFTALTSLQELRAEGVQMVHCVESRFADCATGNSVVYRIQGALLNRQPVRATVEFSRTARKRRFGGDAVRWSLRELKGRFNAEPGTAVRRIAWKALEALNNAG